MGATGTKRGVWVLGSGFEFQIFHLVQARDDLVFKSLLCRCCSRCGVLWLGPKIGFPWELRSRFSLQTRLGTGVRQGGASVSMQEDEAGRLHLADSASVLSKRSFKSQTDLIVLAQMISL